MLLRMFISDLARAFSKGSRVNRWQPIQVRVLGSKHQAKRNDKVYNSQRTDRDGCDYDQSRLLKLLDQLDWFALLSEVLELGVIDAA